MIAVSTGDSAVGPPLEGRAMELQEERSAAARGRGLRGLFEWSRTSAPVAALLLAGIALGPAGLSLLSADTLSLLAPAVPVTIGALGVLVGLSVGVGKTDAGRVVLPACLDAVVTLVVVGVGMAVLTQARSEPLSRLLLVLISGAGLSAASSLALPTGDPLEPRPAGVRLVEIGVLVPILLGGGMLAWIHTGGPLLAAASMAAASGLICALALAAWLLLTVAANETEERVLTVSALLLVGGLSDALSTSALFGGVVAGSLWRFADRRPIESIRRDVRFVERPLVAGLLLTAGASAPLSGTSLLYGALYVACRVVGRLAGGLVARWTRGRGMSADLTSHLLPPGVCGVAFALNASVIIGPDASLLLGTVIVGTLGSELVAFMLSTRRTVR